MRIIAVDPGSERSAWVIFDTVSMLPVRHGIDDNGVLVSALPGFVDAMVIEWMQPRGMPTSAQEYETLFWIGRFVQHVVESPHDVVVDRLSRLRVKQHICGRNSANDSNIIAALIDRYGGTGGRAAAVGVKARPGPLYGVSRDVWQALALAITYWETRDEQ